MSGTPHAPRSLRTWLHIATGMARIPLLPSAGELSRTDGTSRLTQKAQPRSAQTPPRTAHADACPRATLGKFEGRLTPDLTQGREGPSRGSPGGTPQAALTHFISTERKFPWEAPRSLTGKPVVLGMALL